MTTALFIRDANETFSCPNYSMTASRTSATDINLSGGTIHTPCRIDGGGLKGRHSSWTKHREKKTPLTPQPVLKKLRKAEKHKMDRKKTPEKTWPNCFKLRTTHTSATHAHRKQKERSGEAWKERRGEEDISYSHMRLHILIYAFYNKYCAYYMSFSQWEHVAT